MQEICSRLWCKINGRRSCRTKNTPPADGTSCGSTNVCNNTIRQGCVVISYSDRFAYKESALMAAVQSHQ